MPTVGIPLTSNTSKLRVSGSTPITLATIGAQRESIRIAILIMAAPTPTLLRLKRIHAIWRGERPTIALTLIGSRLWGDLGVTARTLYSLY